MNKSYIEFNSDLFLCNTITDNDSEKYIDTNEDCNSKEEDNKLSCEKKKKFANYNLMQYVFISKQTIITKIVN